MKYSKRFLNKKAWAAIAVVVVLLGAFFAWNELSLNYAQQEFCALLNREAGNYNEDRVVLPDTNRREAEIMAEEFGGRLRITDDGKFAVINLPEGVTLTDIAENDQYRKYHDKIALDYNNFSTADEDVADDTEIRSGYVVEDPMYAQQTYIDYLNIGGTWDLSRGKDSSGEKVTVAIIDTGIDTDHPEFFDADGNCIISTQSYDASNDKVVDQYDMSVIEDTDGHGTGVAGIIAAQMNDVGIAGIAPDVELLVIKCDTDEAGEFKSSADIVFAIYYAIEMDVDVINMSLGGGGGEDMAWALQLAVDSDIICVAAAGNDNTDFPHYPAAYENVIGVGALAADSWELADYSNYGINSDIVAPGTALTAAVGGEYAYQNGTSVSAPMVTAAVALYKSQNKYATYDDLKADLLAAGKDLGTLGEDNRYGFGTLDMNAFLCEEKGTITYDYCTEEIKSTTQVFVRRHTIQTVPEPEREHVVFDDWYFDKAYTRVFDYDAWYSTEFVEDVTLYAKWVNEDDEDASVYNYRTLADGTIEIVSYKGKRRYLTIPNEIDGKIVSSIGARAFENNTRLREVTFPEGLVYIKSYAFSGVNKMRKITFTGEQLNSIGDGGFSGCTSLRQVELHDSVQTIGKGAFSGCSSMTAVDISKNSRLTAIGDSAFSNTSITSFYIPKGITSEGFDGSVLFGCFKMQTVSIHPENSAFVIRGDTLYNAAGTEIVYYPAALTGHYTVADGVNTIGDYAFYGASISGLDLNATVNIGSYAFSATKNLTTVVIPNDVTSMGSSAFASSSVSQVTLSESLTSISASAFSSTKLTGVYIPANIQTISAYAFSGCKYMQELTFAENAQLTEIDNSAFAYCTILGNFELPDSLQTIESYAFSNCQAITSLTIPANVSSMGSSVFQYCSMLQQVDFADGCTLATIPAYCFANCTALHTVNFSDGIIKLGNYAFSNDQTLSVLNFGEGSNLTIVGEYCFYSCASLPTMQLPAGVTTVGQFAYAFSGLKQVEIYDKMTDIGRCAFGACYLLTELTVDEANTVYTAVDNVLFNKDVTTVYCVPASRTGSYTLPETVKITAPYSFYYDKYLTAVILPQSLEDIQMNSFYSCNSLAGIEIPSNVTNIGRKAFENCYSMANVTFAAGSKLHRLGIYTFVNCGFKEIIIPASVEEMAQYVFYNCNDLKEITFEENSALTYIAAYLFKGTRVETVVFGEGSALASIQARAFDGANYLRSVDFGDAQITNVDNYAFYGCTRLEKVDIPDTVTYIGRYAFYGCSRLDRIDLPKSVDYIGESAFYGTDKIRVFFAADELPANVQVDWDKGVSGYFLGAVDYVVTEEWEYSVRNDGTIALAAYKGAASELSIDALDGYTVSRIGARCFYNNDTLTSVTLSENIIEIGNYAFFDCDGLTTMAVPASVEKIGKYAFSKASANVSIGENSVLSIIDDYAFSGNGTVSLVLPDTVTKIGDGAFQESSLTSLTIGKASNLETIGAQTFAGTSLTGIHLPASLNTVGAEAFQNVTSLTTVEIAEGDAALKLSNGAFEGSGITEITIPARVWYIGEYTLGSCQNLQNIHVSSSNAAYAELDGVLCDINGTTLIQYPCGRSGAYEVPEQITVLTYSSFRDAKKLTEVTFAEGNSVRTIGWQTFSGCDSLKKITIPDSVVSFDFYAFENCTALTDVILGEKTQLAGVYEGAFYGCSALQNIMLPDTVEEISDYAFYNCRALSAIPLSETSQVKGIYSYAFYGCYNITEIPVFAQLVEIGECAFAYTDVAEYTVGAGVEDIASNAFDGCENLTMIYCSESNEEYVAMDGALYEKGASDAADYEALVVWPHGKLLIIGEGKTRITGEDTEFINDMPAVRYGIADSVTSIAARAFYSCKNLSKLVIPETVTSIGQYAFCGTSLRSAGPIGGGYSVEFGWTEEIPANAFCGCYSLSSVTIPDGITTIGANAFQSCNAPSIYIPDSVTTIETGAFDNFDGIILFGAESLPVNLGEDWTDTYRTSYYLGVKDFVKENGFSFTIMQNNTAAVCQYTGKERVVEIPTSVQGYPVTTIGARAFYDRRDSDLNAVWIPKSITAIEEEAFYQSELVILFERISAPPTLEERWGDSCDIVYDIARCGFTNYDQFYCVTNNNEAMVGRYYGESTSVNIPETIAGAPVTRILNSAFSDRTDLKSVRIPESVRSIGSSAFYFCQGLTEIDLPDGLTSLGAYAFRFCSGLNSISIPDGVTTLLSSTFDDCTNLKQVKLPKNLKTIDTYVFMDCPNLTSIVIPEQVTTIGYMAFSGCKQLKTVYIASPEIAAVLASASDAGYLCEHAEVVAISDSTTEIGAYITANFTETEQITLDQVSYQAYSNHVHNWEQTADTAFIACQQEGKTEYECTECGLLRNTVVPAHDLTESITKEVGCVEDGIRSITCSRCDYLEEHQIPAIGGHTWGGWHTVEEATDDSSGQSRHTCQRCGYVETRDFIVIDGDMCGENMQWILTNTGELRITGSGEMTNWTSSSNVPWASYVSEIASVHIESGITNVGAYAFYNCTALTDVSLPESITAIGAQAFSGCTALTKMELPSGLTNIDRVAFLGCTKLSGITIPESVTSIGDYAFKNCTTLSSITLPDNLISIGEYMFTGCTGLTAVDLPEGLLSIEWGAFSGCSNLKEIDIPESVTKVDGYAFSGCTGLTGISIRAFLTDIHEYAFSGCNGILAYDVDPKNPVYSSVDGVLFNKKGTVLRQYPLGRTGHYVVPDGVTEIGEYAFYSCTGLTGVTLPKRLNAIRNHAFYGCSNLEEITIPDRIRGIGNAAFHSCSSLASIVLPNSITRINGYVFYNCTDLQSITIPAEIKSVDDYAFSGCSSLQDIYLSDLNAWLAISYGDYSAKPLDANSLGKNLYVNGELLTNLVLPEGMTSIPDDAFINCACLEQVAIPESVTTIGSYAFSKCTGLKTLTIPKNVTSISNDAFFGCSGLTSVSILGNLSSLSSRIFGWCSNLTSITIPESVTSIGYSAFGSCSSLKELTIPQNVTSIGSHAFSNCTSLEDMILPNGLTKIDMSVFKGCVGLTNITIPGSVSSIGDFAFDGCSGLTDIRISRGVTSIGSTTFRGCTGLTNIVIPDTVTSIGNTMFSGCTGLNCVIFTGNVPGMDSNVFKSVNATAYYPADNDTWTSDVLQNYGGTITWEPVNICQSHSYDVVVVPATCTEQGYTSHTCTVCGIKYLDCIVTAPGHDYQSVVTEPTESTFGYTTHTCKNCNDIYVDSYVTTGNIVASGSCGTHLEWFLTEAGDLWICGTGEMNTWTRDSQVPWYSHRNSVVSVHFTDGVTGIGNYAFRSFSKLTEITIPDSITCIGNYAFYYCSKLTSITIPKGVTSIGTSAFGSCGSLTGIWVEEGNTCYASDESGVLYDIKQAILVQAPGKLQGEYVIPDGITQIGGSAFNNCVRLTKIVLPEGLTHIGSSAFYYCKNLASITLPDSVTSIGGFAFSNCSSLTSIAIPDGVTYINQQTFDSCSNLSKITIPASVSQIGVSAFQNCYSLTSAGPIGGGYSYEFGWTEKIPNSAFTGCSNMTSAVIPEGITSIGSEAFRWCGLTSVTLPESLTSIGSSAFNGCSLTSITIPENVTSIGNSAFINCRKLEKIIFNATSMGDLAAKNQVFQYAGSSGNGITVMIGANVTKIPAYLFNPYNSSSYAPKITNVVFAEGSVCESLGASAFQYCTSLEEIRFTGDALEFGDANVFGSVVATAYYPNGNETWDNKVMRDYGGTITWMPMCTEHEWNEWTVATEASCEQEGEKRRDCTACGHCEMETIPATGHSYESVVTAPTCTSEGFTTNTCTACGNTYKDAYVQAKGHTAGDIVVENAVEGTCETGGSYDNVVYCTACDTELSRETVTDPSSGHVEAAPVRENEIGATVETAGSYERVVYCAVCGAELSRETVELPKYLGKTESEEMKDDTLPEAIRGTYESAAELETDMVNAIAKNYEALLEQTGVETENMQSQLLDVELHYSADGGETWTKADEEHFPEDGKIEVILLIPEGTSHSTHTYFVAHMFTTNAFGKVVGDMEYPDVTEFVGEDGKEYIKFVVTGLSPIAVVSAEAPSAAEPCLGDLDLDGDVDAEDLTILARHVAGIEVLTDATALANADVDGTGEITAEDLTLHARYVAGIITDWKQG